MAKGKSSGWYDLRSAELLHKGMEVMVRWTPPKNWRAGVVAGIGDREILIELSDGGGGLYLPRTGITKMLKVWHQEKETK